MQESYDSLYFIYILNAEDNFFFTDTNSSSLVPEISYSFFLTLIVFLSFQGSHICYQRYLKLRGKIQNFYWNGTTYTMDGRVFQLSMFFLLCICFVSDTSIAEKPPIKAISQTGKLTSEENQMFFSFSNAATELDEAPGTIPIVNPTTPTTTTPIVNPESPPPPINTGPMTNPSPNTNAPASSGGTWCIANPTASPTALQVALDYACGYGGADCSGIQPGGSCYDPSTVKDHASYAFNDYYQKNPIPTSCVFGGTAQLTSTDPSYGNCHFPSSTKTPTTPPPTTPQTPAIPTTTPSTTTPVNPYPPAGPTGYGSEPTEYGSEPTGTPSSAETVSYKLQQLLVVACLTLWIPAAIYL